MQQGVILSQNQSSLMSSNKCSDGIMVRVDGKTTKVTAPNPFRGLSNPGMETLLKGHFSLELMTSEIGLFHKSLIVILNSIDTVNLVMSYFNNSVVLENHISKLAIFIFINHNRLVY